MPNPVCVFVSHHHSPKEDAFTARLVAELEAAGAQVWVDVAGVGAEDFQKRINQALATCEWFVLVLTPDAIASTWVEMEVHAAIRLKTQGLIRGIIQLIAQPVAQSAIPPMWGIFADFDATRDYAAALAGLYGTLGLDMARSLAAAGRAHNLHDEFDQAIPLLRHAVALNSHYFPAWDHLAWSYNEVAHHTEALAASDQAIALDSNHASVHNNRDWALNALARFEEGLDEALRSIELGPSRAGSWNTKAWALLKLSRCDEALAASRESVRLSKEQNGWFLNTLGDVHMCLGQCKEALEVFDRARIASPHLPNLLAHLEKQKARARHCMSSQG